MAAKAWSAVSRDARKQATEHKPVDEIFFQNDTVSLCLLVNRRTRTMRVIDFRAGPTPGKRTFVLSLAQREGVEKVYTLVERDEVATWVKLGFAKEGSIPGFYKRSDAFLLGCSASQRRSAVSANDVRPNGTDAKRQREQREREEVSHSEIRIVSSAASTSERELAPANPALELMERTVVQAKRVAKELVDKPLPQAKVAMIREVDAMKKVAAQLKAGRA